MYSLIAIPVVILYWYFMVHRFPEPIRHTLTPAGLRFYWRILPRRHRRQCEFLIYRLDPALAPFPSFSKIRQESPAYGLFLSGSLPEVAAKLGMVPDAGYWQAQSAYWPSRFLIRLQRTWSTAGRNYTKEICICPFEEQQGGLQGGGVV